MKQILSWLGRVLVFWWLDRLLVIAFVLLFYPFTRIYCKVKVYGQQNFPHCGRVMLVADHPSIIGIFVLLFAVFWPWVLRPGKISMVPGVLAKNTYKPFWWVFTLRFNIFGVPPKDNKAGRRQVLHSVIHYLRYHDNCVVLNFAAGTRNEPGQQGLPHVDRGVGLMLDEAEPLLVFASDDGSGKVWPKGKKFPGWQWRKWHGFLVPHRTEVTIYLSRPLERLSALCQAGKMSPDQLAEYLRLLHEVWRQRQLSPIQVVEIPGYEKVLSDLSLL